MNPKNCLKLFVFFWTICLVIFYGLEPSRAYADTNNIDRISGSDRYITANAISQKGWEQSDYVVLARGDDFADALCAGPLASKYNAPILMTQPAEISQSTLEEIKRLGAKHVIITGGTGAVSEGIEKTLKESGIKEITRLSGSNRYETSVKIARELSGTKAVLATGQNYPDALSISVVASKLGMPILLTNRNNLPDQVKEYISEQKITKTYVIGGEGAISSQIESAVPGAVRLEGVDRYETNINVMKNFETDFDFSHVYAAVGGGPKGNEFADALTGAVLAANTSSPLILVSKEVPQYTKSYLKTKMTSAARITGLGGEGVVSLNVLKIIAGQEETPDGMLEITPTSSVNGNTQTVTLTYTLASAMDNGTLEYVLPAQITAAPELDKIKIGSGGEDSLMAKQVLDEGRKLSISGITAAAGEKIVLTLANKTVPGVGNYAFRIFADADGEGDILPSSGTGKGAKTFISHATELAGISEKLISYNRPRTALEPKGFVIHSTASPGATAERIYGYFSSGDRQASSHYVADWTEIIRMIPESEVAWHAGPTANYRYLSIEMCEPKTKDPAQFQEVWNRTVLLVAEACVRYGWNTTDNVFSHYGISMMYHETDHTDPRGFLESYDKKWDDLLKAIDNKIAELKENIY
ncbi:N-acetylmuramoyl-L-alanine amidase family 2 [Syntrophobotulus glycolicus DSM 8271]|uniref:N-acetylmuramoyl-L-alanine amidase family 2 n=1 Tax=Syntrophobotulus glycolicus (strain DSM 8271 / FlGlyR) TaxID=645991 RepID=F0SUR7_SYNGF|nr:cell wall-binding repeat-containing protein [Syntrophobotulus glycolicus]ADY56633.1 N-acetylmuramoyl-L-alanine amidase family 2 [Syntrophobotulus glycolicus DSM 8271]